MRSDRRRQTALGQGQHGGSAHDRHRSLLRQLTPSAVSALVSARNASSSPALRISSPADGRVLQQQRARGGFGVGGDQAHAVGLRVDAGDAGQRRQRLVRQPRAAGDLAAGGVRLDLVRPAVGDDAAAVEHHDAIGQRVGFLEIVRRQQDRAARGGERRARSARTAGAPRRPCRRSVRRGRAVPGCRRSPARTARAASVRPTGFRTADRRPTRAPPDRSTVVERQRARVVRREQVDVLADGQRLGHARDLQHHAHAAPARHGLRVAAEQLRLAFAWGAPAR